jgi:hypothetical protein
VVSKFGDSPPLIFKEKLYEFSTKEFQLLLLLLLFVVRWQNFAKKRRRRKKEVQCLNPTLFLTLPLFLF